MQKNTVGIRAKKEWNAVLNRTLVKIRAKNREKHSFL